MHQAANQVFGNFVVIGKTHCRIAFGLGDDMREFVTQPIDEILLLHDSRSGPNGTATTAGCMCSAKATGLFLDFWVAIAPPAPSDLHQDHTVRIYLIIIRI